MPCVELRKAALPCPNGIVRIDILFPPPRVSKPHARGQFTRRDVMTDPKTIKAVADELAATYIRQGMSSGRLDTHLDAKVIALLSEKAIEAVHKYYASRYKATTAANANRDTDNIMKVKVDFPERLSGDDLLNLGAILKTRK